MNPFFPRYLLSKQTIDDRAINKDVLDSLKINMPGEPLTIIEVGGGIGTMPARLLRWGFISQAEYTLVDKSDENIGYARVWLPEWARENGFDVKLYPTGEIEVFDKQRCVCVKLVRADIFEYSQGQFDPADLLIAHAFLDMLPLPEGLCNLFKLTKNLAWLTLNFDGVTTLEPVIDAELDARIERLYHATMDSRLTGGDSLSGRHLFRYLDQARAEIVSAGASDWVAYPVHGHYPADEAYFLQYILHFFEESLGNHPELDPAAFADWLGKRRGQVERGELVYIAHQIDFLCKVASPFQGEGPGEGGVAT